MSTDSRAKEGGPLEKTHMRDMVLKNALESAALMKTSRHLESQKKAFVRQNTRDEVEMKSLLHRLHVEQQTVFTEDDDDHLESGQEVKSIAHNEDCDFLTMSRFEMEPLSNPYPVTIIPRFGGAPRAREPVSKTASPKFGTPSFRRKSIEYEDIQDALTSMAISDIPASDRIYSGSTSCIPRDTTSLGDWLATPDAISSVRRMRKSVTEQSRHRKVLRMSSTDSQHSMESVPEEKSGPRNARNSPLRERQRKDTDHLQTPPSPRKLNPVRSRSLREWKLNYGEQETHASPRVFMRSYSVLTKGTIKDSDSVKLNVRPNSEHLNSSVEAHVIKHTSSKKRTLSKKLSNESTGSVDLQGSPRGHRRHLSGRSGISDDSGMDDVFKF